jgi:4-amino-4-deoxy-L-arabinose transferase-like glycosyltransferase
MYPPLVTFLALAVRAMGMTTINPYLFNFCLFAIGLVVMLGMARQLLKHEWLACAAVVLALLNPYFVWTALLSKDTSAELGLTSALLWLVGNSCEASPGRCWRLGAGIVVIAGLLTLTRVTGVFITFAVLFIAFLISREGWQKRLHASCAAVFLVFVLAFCAYNQARVGAFVLATNGGYNLYLGNHPAYLHGHPHYDIDVFLRPIDLHNELSSLSEAELNREYTKRARALIQADLASFAYRVIVKSVWHWFNLEKIPNYTSASEIEKPLNGEGWEARLGPIHITPSLAYLLYKLAYLPVFILGIVTVLRRKLDRGFALLYGPMLGLWPVVALTFPDTRFKICAEAIVLPVLVAVVLQWRKQSGKNSLAPTAT